jgi:dolichol-phosphate mannosyltransferase
MLTIDADVRTAPGLLPALLAHATRMSLPAFSVATRQRLSGAAEGVLHPAMLATLVYRFGIPGSATNRVDRVQANGQCFLVRRTELERAGGFATVLGSVCEDVTLARALAASGVPVGFHEAGDLVSVEMYGSAREAWTNWSRSLPMRDRFSGAQGLVGLAEVLLVQGLPPWLLTGLGPVLGRGHPLVTLNIALLGVRLGTLAGMARAYDHRPPTYWLSPLADLPVALRLIQMYFRRRHTWRGRPFVAGDLP